MPIDGKDDGWIGRLLSHHADRRDLDLDAFMIRIMTEVDTSRLGPDEVTARPSVPVEPVGVRRPDSAPASVAAGLRVRKRPIRRRLVPALIAAVWVFAVVGSSVSMLARWVTRDDRVAVLGSPSLSPSASPTPSLTLSPTPGVRGSTSSPSVTPSLGTPTSAVRRAKLPSTFQWQSSAPLILSRADAGGVTGMKDPTVVRYGGKWHVFTTTVSSTGYGLDYFSFGDWSAANSAKLHRLNATPIGAGFRASPQVFYFAPQKLWYLVYQTGNASYSTNPDINNPKGWSAPKDFYAGVPELIRKNLVGGFWVDMWVICDETDCYLFSSDNRGHLFRSQTPKASFPSGMSQPVVAAQDSGQGTTFAASDVYRVAGTGQYLLLSQAFGGDGRGYLRSWTAPRLTAPWTPLAGTSAAPFAGAANINSPASPWSRNIIQGELLRDGYDETLTVSPCRLRFLYLGLDPEFNDNRSFKIGLLTQTNSTCP